MAESPATPDGAASRPEESAEAAGAPEEPSPPRPKPISLAGLKDAFMGIIGSPPAVVAPSGAEAAPEPSRPLPTEGEAGRDRPLLDEEVAPADPHEPEGEGPDGGTAEMAGEAEAQEPEDGDAGDGPAVGRSLLSAKGLVTAFGSIFGGGRKAADAPSGPAAKKPRPLLSWLGGHPAGPAVPARTPAAFGPPRTGTPQEIEAIPSLLAALDGGDATLAAARAEAANLLLRTPAAFAAVEVSTGWPPVGKRPSFGPFWSRAPSWLAATADASAVLVWPTARLDSSSGEVHLGDPAWSDSRRGPVCVYAMGPGGVQESLRREWHREAYLAVGQSLDAAMESVYDRYGAPGPERWEAALGLLGAGHENVRLGGRAGLFGLGRRPAAEALELDATGAKALLSHLTVPATIHLVLRHVRRTRSAVLAALVPGEATMRIGWAESEGTSLPLSAAGVLSAPRAHLGSPEASLHPQKELMSARGGAAWNRRLDEGEAGWMLRLAVERVVYREGWLDLLERCAAESWNVMARLGGGPTLEFGGERRWPWTEALITEVAGGEQPNSAAIAARVLSRIDLFAHAAPGNPRPFAAHVRLVIEQALLLS